MVGVFPVPTPSSYHPNLFRCYVWGRTKVQKEQAGKSMEGCSKMGTVWENECRTWWVAGLLD